MDEKEIQFYAQKKSAEEYEQSCKYAIGNSKLLQLVKDVCLMDLLLIALFRVLPDSAC